MIFLLHIILFISIFLNLTNCQNAISTRMSTSFLSELIFKEFKRNVAITLIKTDGDCNDSKPVMGAEFFANLLTNDIPVKIICTNSSTQQINPRKNKYPQPNLFLIETSAEPSKLNNSLKLCQSLLKPKLIHEARFIFLNNDRNSGAPNILNQPVLRNIPYKMEIKAGHVHGIESDRIIIWSHCHFCPEVTKELGRSRHGFILIGVYSNSEGYQEYNSWFPDFSNHLNKSSIKLIQPMPYRYAKGLAVAWERNPWNPYRLMAKAVLEDGMNFEIDKNIEILDNYQLGKNDSNDQILRFLNLMQKSNNMQSFSTVYVRGHISDRFVQSSTYYKRIKVVMIYRKFKPNLSIVLEGFLISWRWPILGFTIFAINLFLRIVLRVLKLDPESAIVKSKDSETGLSLWTKLWPLSMIFMQQGEFPRAKVKEDGHSGALTFLCWAIFSIVYVWQWKIEVLDTFMAPDSPIKINTMGDVVRINDSDEEIRLNIAVFASPELHYDFIISPLSEVPESKHLKVLQNTKFLNTYTVGCINEALKIESPNEYNVCVGGWAELEVAYNSMLKKDVRLSSLEIKFVSIPLMYQNLAFPNDFPWVKKVDRKLMAMIEAGFQTYWEKANAYTPPKGWDKEQKMIDEFSGQVDLEVIELILKAFIWYFVLAFVVFALEIGKTGFKKLRALKEFKLGSMIPCGTLWVRISGVRKGKQ